MERSDTIECRSLAYSKITTIIAWKRPKPRRQTGSIYLRARYYVPGLGRFTTQDPIRDGLNWYTYCGNNPVKFVDPTGLWTVSLGLAVNATMFWGASYSVGLSWDGRNLVVQHSYTGSPTKSPHAGLFDIGGGGYFQYTNAETVYDLEQDTVLAGLSGGSEWYVGADAIMFLHSGKAVDGFQIQGGVGVGVDAHVMQPQTDTLTTLYSAPKATTINDSSAAARTSYNNRGYTTYTVKPGDSFWKIAQQYMGSGTKYNDLAKANNMTSSSLIHPGDVLIIPQ